MRGVRRGGRIGRGQAGGASATARRQTRHDARCQRHTVQTGLTGTAARRPQGPTLNDTCQRHTGPTSNDGGGPRRLRRSFDHPRRAPSGRSRSPLGPFTAASGRFIDGDGSPSRAHRTSHGPHGTRCCSPVYTEATPGRCAHPLGRTTGRRPPQRQKRTSASPSLSVAAPWTGGLTANAARSTGRRGNPNGDPQHLLLGWSDLLRRKRSHQHADQPQGSMGRSPGTANPERHGGPTPALRDWG